MSSKIDEIVTSDLAQFGYRERKMAAELLTASVEQGFPQGFDDDGVTVAMNRNSGYVFLTNENFDVAMMNGDTLETWYPAPSADTRVSRMTWPTKAAQTAGISFRTSASKSRTRYRHERRSPRSRRPDGQERTCHMNITKGAQIVYTGLLATRTLLGDVTDTYYDQSSGMTRLRVRHFNGEPWPFDPLKAQVEILDRDSQILECDQCGAKPSAWGDEWSDWTQTHGVGSGCPMDHIKGCDGTMRKVRK